MPEKGTVAGVGSWETKSADCSREACSEDSPWKGRTQVSGCCARKVPLSRSRTRIATRSRKLRPDARHAATAPPVQSRRQRGRQATNLFDARPSGLEYPQPSRAASIGRRCDDLKPLVHRIHSRSPRTKNRALRGAARGRYSRLSARHELEAIGRLGAWSTDTNDLNLDPVTRGIEPSTENIEEIWWAGTGIELATRGFSVLSMQRVLDSSGLLPGP